MAFGSWFAALALSAGITCLRLPPTRRKPALLVTAANAAACIIYYSQVLIRLAWPELSCSSDFKNALCCGISSARFATRWLLTAPCLAFLLTHLADVVNGSHTRGARSRCYSREAIAILILDASAASLYVVCATLLHSEALSFAGMVHLSV